MDNEHTPSTGRPHWKVQLVTTVAGWLAAFLIVTTVLRTFGVQLAAMPLELRALVLSGVLVGLMSNVVMPLLTAIVTRRFAAGAVEVVHQPKK